MATQRRAQSNRSGDARDALLKATQQLIDSGGLAAATSRSIAETADQNLAAITYYFGSKDHLVHEALIETAATLIQPVIETLQGDEDPSAKLGNSLQLLQRLLSGNQNQLSGYVHALASATYEPLVRESLQSLHDTITAAITKVLQTQRDQGAIPEWADPESMADLFVTLAKGVAVSSATGSSDDRVATLGQQFATLLVAARSEPKTL